MNGGLTCLTSGLSWKLPKNLIMIRGERPDIVWGALIWQPQTTSFQEQLVTNARDITDLVLQFIGSKPCVAAQFHGNIYR